MKKIISTQNAPAAIGPYSQAIQVSVSDMLFVSGQIGFDPKTTQLVSPKVEDQTRQALNNLSAILDEAGFKKDDIVKVTIFLKNMDDFLKVNEIYGAFFERNPPARSTVEVARLPKDALVEIEATAVH